MSIKTEKIIINKNKIIRMNQYLNANFIRILKLFIQRIKENHYVEQLSNY